MAKRMAQNSYRTLPFGRGVVAGHEAMQAAYLPKVKIVNQILHLSAGTIADVFGVVGKAYIDGIRHAMVLELDACPVPLTGWREVADRVKGRHSSDYA